MRPSKKSDYTNEELIAQSEAAERATCPELSGDSIKNPDGTFNSDGLAATGATIPARDIDARDIIKQFDKPDDLTWIDDLTPNGKRLGTQIVVHKKHEAFMRRRFEIIQDVWREAGVIIGDQDHDTFISFEEMFRMQKEAERRHNEEIARQN